VTAPTRTAALAALYLALGAAAPSTARADGTRLTNGNSAFAMDLYARLAKNKGNVFFSPYSLSAALAMADAGAKGDTAGQMTKVLHWDGLNDVPGAFAAQALGLSKDAGSTLSIANALWAQNGTPVLPSYASLLQKDFGAGLSDVDFTSSDGAITIDDWVSKATHGKIPELLPKAPIDGAQLVLTNAVYFKGDWLNAFSIDNTAPGPFHRLAADGGDTKVSLMHETSTLPFYQGDGFDMVELPYKDGHLAMDVLVPQANDGIGKVEAGLSASSLKDDCDALTPALVDLTLPKLHLATQAELSSTLVGMGMPLAFSDGGADFSGMNGVGGIHIDQVIHQATLDVDEKGSVATAATAIVMTEDSAVEEPESIPVDADHPFVLIIRDTRTGDILFLGRISDPA
jgi:serpin B